MLKKEHSTDCLKVGAQCRTASTVTTITCAEETLWETKEVVRQKLGLTSGEDVQLAQLRAGLTIDLEDGTSL
jgi:hypothetical protein